MERLTKTGINDFWGNIKVQERFHERDISSRIDLIFGARMQRKIV